jgi:hypothetical protein
LKDSFFYLFSVGYKEDMTDFYMRRCHAVYPASLTLFYPASLTLFYPASLTLFYPASLTLFYPPSLTLFYPASLTLFYPPSLTLFYPAGQFFLFIFSWLQRRYDRLLHEEVPC